MVLVYLINNITLAQNTEESYIVMDFLKIPNTHESSYNIHQENWKQACQKMTKQGVTKASYLYKVHFLGKEYNYISIHQYSNFNGLKTPVVLNNYEFKDNIKMKSEMSKMVAFAGENKPSKYLLTAFIIVVEKDKKSVC